MEEKLNLFCEEILFLLFNSDIFSFLLFLYWIVKILIGTLLVFFCFIKLEKNDINLGLFWVDCSLTDLLNKTSFFFGLKDNEVFVSFFKINFFLIFIPLYAIF